jgi:putative proteasome-type protease
MTYCVAVRLKAGLVFLSDSRTNAGVDHISTFRKMTVFEIPGERVMVLLSSGNLAITQAVVNRLLGTRREGEPSLWNAGKMFNAAHIIGEAVRAVHRNDAEALQHFQIDFNANFLFGGQIRGEAPRLFSIYSAGNYIEATEESPYFQIGELKYGKPILDRVITPDTTLDEAAKCALVSMDSTLRSNISVGLPLDLLVYEADSLKVSRFVTIDQLNPYFRMISTTWGARLRQVFSEIPNPTWQAGPDETHALHGGTPPRAPLPVEPATAVAAIAGETQTAAGSAQRRAKRGEDSSRAPEAGGKPGGG